MAIIIWFCFILVELETWAMLGNFFAFRGLGFQLFSPKNPKP